MRILFVIDKIEYKYFEFNDLVTNFWMVKEYSRAHDVYITTIDKLSLIGDTAYAVCNKAYIDDENITYDKKLDTQLIDEFDMIFFRPDPPVDSNYINATYIFDFVKNTFVINKPSAIRNFNEKLHALRFKEYMPETIVTSSLQEIEEFLAVQNEIIIKPLNNCFGAGVMYLKQGDMNTRSIINTMTSNESSYVMVQKYLSAGIYGDKRVLILGDKVLDYCIVKHPTSDDFKFNTHNDKYITKGILSSEEKRNFKKIAKVLNDEGLYMAGLDVIDGRILEINVTSPCYFIRENNAFFDIHLEKIICNFFEKELYTNSHQKLLRDKDVVIPN